MGPRSAIAVAIIALLSSVSAAHAQDAPTGAITYDPAFFASFQPRTALDMVRRVPGFTISEGEERRGLAGAAGNVLIDGAAPVAKSEDLDDILDRIPAADVVRIELLRGEGASASSAQSVRVNVVRRPSAGQGVWEAALERSEDGRVSPAGQASWSGRRGAVDYTLSATAENGHAPIGGDVRRFDAGGLLDQHERERITETSEERGASGGLTSPLRGGVLTLNASLASDTDRDRQTSYAFGAAEIAEGSEHARSDEEEVVGELSANYARSMGRWDAEFSALATRRQLTNDERVEERTPGGAFEGADTEDREVESGEAILRAQFERDTASGAHLTFSAEGAFNTLEQTLSLTEDDGSGPVAIIPPGANVRIEEWRAEFAAAASWRPAPRWTIEAGVAVETSRLEQSGDVAEETALTYWKPSLQLLRSVGDDDQIRLRVYRDVGQLDFEDFAASAELESSIIDAGNANLRPETSWRLEAAADWRFTEGALQLMAFYWAIEDALDFIPFGPPGDQFDARGNIGDATLYGVRAVFEWPAPFLDGASFRGETVWQESEATDPLTGDARPQSEIIESSVSLEFRHDIEVLNLSWGVNVERERLAPEVRLDRSSDDQDADSTELWLETTRFGGVKLRLFAETFANTAEVRDRIFYDPDRTGAFDGTERRTREHGPIFGISMQGAF